MKNLLHSTFLNPWIKIDLIFESFFVETKCKQKQNQAKNSFENRRKSFESSIWRNTPSFISIFNILFTFYNLLFKHQWAFHFSTDDKNPFFMTNYHFVFPKKWRVSIWRIVWVFLTILMVIARIYFAFLNIMKHVLVTFWFLLEWFR